MKKVSLICFFILLSLNAKAEIIGTWPCGDDCTATLDDSGLFKVTGTGATRQYDHYSQPWSDKLSQITSVEIEGLTTISPNLTYFSPITELKLSDSVKNILGGFEGNHLQKLELPDSVERISNYALASSSLVEIIVPDSILSFGGPNSLGGLGQIQNKNIICRGDNCDKVSDLLKNYIYKYQSNGESLLTTADVSDRMSLAGENQCNSAKYYWTGGLCNNRPTDGSAIECDEGWYATNKDVCARIKLRYTLPEADELTSNDNENMIEWIFE